MFSEVDPVYLIAKHLLTEAEKAEGVGPNWLLGSAAVKSVGTASVPR